MSEASSSSSSLGSLSHERHLKQLKTKTTPEPQGSLAELGYDPATYNYYAFSFDEVASRLLTDLENGLSSQEVAHRREIFGSNDLKLDSGPSFTKILLSNIFTLMNLILAFAMGLSFFEHDKAGKIQFALLGCIILANTSQGTYEEFKSAKKMEALNKFNAPTSRVIRDEGNMVTIPTAGIVPGDLVVLEEGDQIPADLRLTLAVGLRIDEALLTGESLPQRKITDTVPSPASVPDRQNSAFKSTVVSTGRGRGIVIATGVATEIGKIADIVLKNTSKNKKTPLQKTMNRMMILILAIASILALIVMIKADFAFKEGTALMYAIATAVAILPEGLHTVVIVTMSRGVSRMAKEKAVVRKAVALEALGQVTNICSDKTGTLTEGRMSLVAANLAGIELSFTGSLYIDAPDPKIVRTTTKIPFSSASPHDLVEKSPKSPAVENPYNIQFDNELLEHMYNICALCSSAEVKKPRIGTTISPTSLVDAGLISRSQTAPVTTNLKSQVSGEFVTHGDPTEIALAVSAAQAGITKNTLLASRFDFISEFPFDSALKRMTGIFRDRETGDIFLFSKGAFEFLFPLCSHYCANGSVKPVLITSETRAELNNSILTPLAQRGLRVLSLAVRHISSEEILGDNNLLERLTDFDNRTEVERGLCLLGFAGIVDPPRPETASSVADCHSAGIVVHMITGDHPFTAATIAKEVGILPPDFSPETNPDHASLVMSSSQFDSLTIEEIDALPKIPLVVARCSPATKVSIIEALHRRNCFVAMTGDGVNDAPAISYADVGIAMGLTGSDVAKQASDITLTDDKFSTIVKAIAQGRRIFSNIQKFTVHLLSGNVSEVVVLLGGLFLPNFPGEKGLVYPMSAMQILFLNMVTSSPIAILLGMEPASRKVMREKPRTSGVFTWEAILDNFVYGIMMGAFSLTLFYIKRNDDTVANNNDNVEQARGLCFITLSLLIIVHGFNCRSLRRSAFRINPRESKYLIIFSILGAALTILMLLPGLRVPFLHTFFYFEWIYVLASIFLFVAFSELYKFFKRRYFARKGNKNRLSPKKTEVAPLPKSSPGPLLAAPSFGAVDTSSRDVNEMV